MWPCSMAIIGIAYITYHKVTVYPLKKAAAFFTNSKFWMRHSKEGGIYQRAAFNTK